MPVENLEEEGLEKNPNLQLAQWKFQLTTDKYKNDDVLRKDLCDLIRKSRKNGCLDLLFIFSKVKYFLNIFCFVIGNLPNHLDDPIHKKNVVNYPTNITHI